jgi:chromosome segregation ATPase
MEMYETLKKILEFFKKTINWFKNLPPIWKKIFSYFGVFILGCVITLTATTITYSRIQNNLKREGDGITEQLSLLRTENSQLGTTISDLKGSEGKARDALDELRKSDERKSSIIRSLSEDNRRLKEGEGRFTATIDKLEQENRKFREGIDSFDGTNKDFNRTIGEIDSAIIQSGKDCEGIGDSISRSIEILRGL